ncbi:TetR/AcrR family transcriptional regulator [Nonomuraea sp. NPDC047897]|uniref:TetR/AcrR family transcriptional regulator n=1 Tax=Nonomuraea sp. NPDC047897 TaxID=3364346 RepID=UPI00371CEF27
MPEDTRTRIQDIALRLFTEQGYEATSLREIAEELGVTKAALYYHFKTKDDILTSLVDVRVQELEKLLTWVRSQPRTPRTRHEVVVRYAGLLQERRYVQITRFLERNQTALRDNPTFTRIREALLDITVELSDPDDPPAVKLSRAMSLFALHAGKWLMQGEKLPEEELSEAAVEVALKLVEP